MKKKRFGLIRDIFLTKYQLPILCLLFAEKTKFLLVNQQKFSSKNNKKLVLSKLCNYGVMTCESVEGFVFVV